MKAQVLPNVLIRVKASRYDIYENDIGKISFKEDVIGIVTMLKIV